MNLIEESFQTKEEKKKKENYKNCISCHHCSSANYYWYHKLLNVYTKYSYETIYRWTRK